MALSPIDHAGVGTTLVDGMVASVAEGDTAVVAGRTVAVFVVGDRHEGGILLYNRSVGSGRVENLSVMIHSFNGSDGGPEAAILGGKGDMFGGIPADTLHAEIVKLLNVGLGAGDDFGIFGIDIAVVAELIVGDGGAVAVVDASVPAHSAVGVPPRVVVAGGLVDMVGNNVDDYFDTICCGLFAEGLEVVGRAHAAAFECDIVGTIEIVPGRAGACVGPLERTQLDGAETGLGDSGQFSLYLCHGPVKTMEDVPLLNGCGQPVVGRHKHPGRAHGEHQRKEIPFDEIHDVRCK